MTWIVATLGVVLALAGVAGAQPAPPVTDQAGAASPRPAPCSPANDQVRPSVGGVQAPAAEPLVITPSGAVMPKSWAEAGRVPHVPLGEHAWWDAR